MPRTRNQNLRTARRVKQDEFYTQLTDIENELKHYRDYFKDKVVYCNCDDPRISNFYQYFSLKFEDIGLKKLITTCYKNNNVDAFSNNDCESAAYIVYTGAKNGNNMPAKNITDKKNLKEDGDFRSKECIKLLKQSDIVVTNPPFSLFREYVQQLVKYDKKFIIIGNKNAITYKEIFKLIQENKIWAGYTPMGTDMLFDVPNNFANELIQTKKEGSGYKIINGVVKARAQAIWLTNVEIKKRYEDLYLCEKYTPEKYPIFDNYNAINVNFTKAIPEDYKGIMGVPITFLSKYNPEQFEILGITDRANTSGLRTKKYTADDTPMYNDLNARGVIKTGNTYQAIYPRVLIKNKRI